MRRVMLAALVAACGAPAPRALGYGSDECSQCHMTLADPRFGGELVLTTGRTIPFDDAGCLATYLEREAANPERHHSVWVTDFLPPHQLIAASEAVFLLSDSIRTPMDYRIAALRPGPSAEKLRASLRGELVSWEEARIRLRTRAIGESGP